MIQNQQDNILPSGWVGAIIEESMKCNEAHENDSIQLQSPEAIALNGLLNDIQFKRDSCVRMSEAHWLNYKGIEKLIGYTKQQSFTAFGIYSNKAQEMEDLLNKWKPNKK